MLLACAPSFAADTEPNVETIFDFSGKGLGVSGGGSTNPYFPTLDGTVLSSVEFSYKAGLYAESIVEGGETVLKYKDKTNRTDAYYTIKIDKKYDGRIVYSGKIYTNYADENGNMLFADATLNVNYGSGGANNCKIPAKSSLNSLKANRWYDFKVEVNLFKDKNQVKYTVTPEVPESSGDNGFTLVDSYDVVPSEVGLSNIRFYYSLDTKNNTNFVAYKDLKLTYTKNPQKLESYVDGTASSDTFRNGIYTAIGSGSGLFALAVYENNELVSIDFKESADELEEVKLNTVIEDGASKKVKVFHFDEHGEPYIVNLSPEFDGSEDVRIYANEDFSNPEENVVVSDGRLMLASKGVGKDVASRPRYNVTALNPGRYIVFEADYSLPEGASPFKIRLMGSYYANTSGGTSTVNTLIRASASGKIYSDKVSGSNFGTLSSTPVNLAMVVDLEENTFDFYVDKVLKQKNIPFLPGDVLPGTMYGDRGFFIGHVSGDKTDEACIGTLLIDNVKMYEGPDFKDIGNKIPNIHHTDYVNKSEIYERPEASEIAKKVLSSSHPRLLINKEKVEEFKNSTDPFVTDIVQRTIAYADSMLDKSIDTEDGVPYEMNGTSVQNLPESRNLMMCLGLSYLLTGDKKYSDRAYEEAERMFEIYSLIDSSKSDADGNRDYWNSYSCLDVTEIPQILSICYDWMYDVWTTEQKEEIIKHVMEKGIDNMYRNYYGMYLPSYANASWWDTKNNQGGVCNGSAIMTAIAFMEEDAHRCSEIAEAGIRALEITLSNFAPDGGWMESASYWKYTLEFVTMAAATLDSVCGTNYGLQNTIGLRNSCFYSLAIEGETGAMSFGDGSVDATNAPFLFYWAKAYKDKSIGAAAMYIKNNFTPGIYDLVYYDADYIGDLELPEFFYYRGTEMVSMRSGSGDKETYIVTTGGKGHSTGHDHLDSGHIILEMNGERVFKDMGAEHYQATGYFGADRHLYFRSRPEGHNIFVINPTVDAKNYPGQDTKAVSTITEYDASGKSATMNLSDAYARDAKKAERKISLEGKNAVIEDTIVLSDGGDIYWNWYVTVKNDKYDEDETAGCIEISNDGKYAIVTQRKDLTDSGRKFKVSFDASCDYTLSVQAADYYVDVMPDTQKSHKKDNERSKRLSVHITGDAGQEIKLKTRVESMVD